MATGPRLLFATGAETLARHVLWVTDGTSAGTYSLIASTSAAYADAEADNSGDFGVLGNRVVFATSDAAHGEEVWVTDGTIAGTSLLKDVNPGPGGSGAAEFTPISNSLLLFTADDGTRGDEVWVTDGTAGGTSMLKDINPGGGSVAGYFIPFKGGALFSANDGGHGGELWTTDGTTVGTSMVKDINPGAASSGFFGSNGAGPRYLLSFGSEAVFIADDGTNGLEPWVTDGTTAGTSLLNDINPGSASSSGHLYSDALTLFGGKAFFQANDGAHGYELWVTDGTTADTSMVKDINSGSGSSYPTDLKTLGNRALFSANDGTHGTELWVTDGTSAGTSMVMDINPGPGSSDPYALTVFGSKVLFSATDGAHGTGLWVTDGTAAGTSMVKEIKLGKAYRAIYDLTVFGNEVMFDANDGTHGYELWVTDGTTAGTSLFADIAAGGTSSYARPVAVISAPCFAAGTRIATPRGAVAVERLRVGGTVLTVSGGRQKIQWIGHRRVDCRRHPNPARVLPIRIAPHAFGLGRPRRSLLLSPDHSVFVEDVLIPIKFLLNGSTVTQVEVDAVTYYHIELPRHDVVLAEGMPAEAYLETGGRNAFDNGGGATQLHPDFAPDEALVMMVWQKFGYAPLLGDGSQLRLTRAKLHWQATLLAGASPCGVKSPKRSRRAA